ncbi:hypothetical protein PVE_R2G0783 [Pseudomonas veronii 1YdBTEX2]|uniref:Uncharacterized protein n=1 Tax=Pseudomonas veronii 1YdBTEX2 TaxID=1295141 RepID=A0A1D3K929_PSEVE|nr:hypothetical protein [Pseudomonas veronii]SBW84808.1 hypothetical protein PVE_R2G0783 [Pseudomonas veronii 1YdBTEX2]
MKLTTTQETTLRKIASSVVGVGGGYRFNNQPFPERRAGYGDCAGSFWFDDCKP